MKKIMLILMLAPIVGLGQSVQKENLADSIKKYVKLVVDEIEGTRSFESDNIIAFSKDKDILVIQFTANEIKSIMDVSFYCKGLICCRDNAKIRFLLEEDVRTVLENEAGYNCSGLQMVNFLGDREDTPDWARTKITPEIKSMASVKPRAVRLEGTGKIIDFYFADEQAEKFRITFASFEKLVGVWSVN
ncbi:MAG TPA: hypothetical protein PL085_11655 [Agriterribacter sp.]|uniref:hypothetical protein n=1 Tax=Agriterribacter sp. TaxID=2821509 RepID=UPI002C4D9DC3|nr:hypothetical protein [Agriterribacter sp.]HRQ17724.1 hypothetical protein [Agriterribacter sp.]